ncbi:CD206 [Mytilus edulis]|uniref:MRC n=1 Tax=Mytilus edulis TaxID=6550 RepID=A0A8S3RRE2_MYTED|nr:CD206 [Mytilus edulis]
MTSNVKIQKSLNQEIIYGQCYRNAALRRLLKVSFLTCLKECMKTSTCSNVSYRRDWKMCDINGNINLDVNLVQEHGCFSSNINSWSMALIGKCARHNCAEGHKCVLNGETTTCKLAYCIGNPNVRNAVLNEPFGLSREMRGKPFAVCRETGKWNSMLICEIQCEKGWIEFGGHCYYIGPDKKRGKILRLVAYKKNIDSLRIGAHDIGQEGRWRWIYDNTAVDFTNWGDRQPNNYDNQDCAELLKSKSYRWNDGACTSLLRYICEK